MALQAARVKMPTSATSPKRCPGQRGFTLIELLVVLAIGGLLVALTPMAYTKARDSAQYSSTLRSVTKDMRQARQNALSQGKTVVFFVDLAKRTYGLTDTTPQHIPESLQIKATVGTEQLKADGLASIEFLPDGGATGGSIELVRSNGAGIRLRVDWLSGQVTQERLLP